MFCRGRQAPPTVIRNGLSWSLKQLSDVCPEYTFLSPIPGNPNGQIHWTRKVGSSHPHLHTPRTQRERFRQPEHSTKAHSKNTRFQRSEKGNGWGLVPRWQKWTLPVPFAPNCSIAWDVGVPEALTSQNPLPKTQSTKAGLWGTEGWWLGQPQQIYLVLPFKQRSSALGPILAQELQVWWRDSQFWLDIHIMALWLRQKRHCLLKSC